MKKSSLYILFPFLLTACYIPEEQAVTRIIEEWSNKEIIFPRNWNLRNYGSDTLQEYIFVGEKYKVLTYVDSVGCVSCKLGLKNWAELIFHLDSFNVPCLFIFNPRKKEITDIKNYLRYSRFIYPVCIDEKDSFNILNKFPQDERFQTFLLNEHNRVLAIGNPIHNPKVKELYLRIIQGKDTNAEPAKPMTTVSINQNSADMGTFDWQQEQTATFTLTNTGDKLLAIEMVDTSCGCITVDYKQEPVHPGKSVALHVTYKADQPEYFSKTVTVYCNAKGAPIRLTVSGNAK